MAKPSKIESSETDYVTYWTGAKATNVYTKIDAIIDDYASISEGVDADTLEGSSKAEVQTHAPASHGNEAHSEEYITAGDVPAGGSGAAGKDGVGFVAGMLTLWDKSLGDVPEDFVEVSELAGTNFTIIKYVGGENETTIITHNIYYEVGANVTLTLTDYSANANNTITGAATGNTWFINPHDKYFTITLAKSTAGDVTYVVSALDPSAGAEYKILDIPVVTVPGESDITVRLTLPTASYINIVQSPP
jgi:hypothetical protein